MPKKRNRISPATRTARVAAGQRTPGEVLDAFAPVPLAIGDLTLRDITPGDFILLERIDSPFADQEQLSGGDITLNDMMILVYVLTRPTVEVFAILGRGREAFDREVIALASRFPFPLIEDIAAKIRAKIMQAFASLITGAPAKKKATTPGNASSAAARPATDLAGS
ncbi:hypothetical protein [Geminisphaera colitermitum]|uniref:hypothetical protein n=1 Tax=Geminisphaera colitermitum TaxID=1148786 RepID=UPI000158C610|nr:hypothetical protein [Geminisphaera colitermitum]